MSTSHDPVVPSQASLERSGAVITALFALAWALTGTTAVHADVAALSAVIIAIAITAGAVLAAVTFGARGGAERDSAPDLVADWRRQFNVIGAVQGGAIALAVPILIRAGGEGLIPASVCLIVGLHFFPVARVLRLRYRPTGAALCVVAVAGFVSYFTTGADWSVVIVGAGAALTLWSASFRHALSGLATATARTR